MTAKKPSHSEDEYFAREEAEKRRRMAIEHAKHMGDEERARLKHLHHNHCPKCGMEMHPLTARGVEVDKCFNCNGIFLDEGELEKIVGKNETGYLDSIFEFFARRDFNHPAE